MTPEEKRAYQRAAWHKRPRAIAAKKRREARVLAKAQKLEARVEWVRQGPARRAAAAERRREQSKRWRLANPDRYRELLRVWRVKNRDKRGTDKRARKVAKRQSLSLELKAAQRGRCAYCQSTLGDDFHIDHIMPLSKGGRSERSNYQLTCATCNLSKNATHPIDYARRIGRLL